MYSHHFQTLTTLCVRCTIVLNLSDSSREEEITGRSTEIPGLSSIESLETIFSSSTFASHRENIFQELVRSESQEAKPAEEHEAIWTVKRNTATCLTTWAEFQISAQQGCCLCSKAWDQLLLYAKKRDDSKDLEIGSFQSNNGTERNVISEVKEMCPMIAVVWRWTPETILKWSSEKKSILVTYDAGGPGVSPYSNLSYSTQLTSFSDDAQPEFRPGSSVTPGDMYRATVVQIDSWLQQDLVLHRSIIDASDGNWHPTRLVENLDPDGSRVRVINARTRGDIVSYAVLSYRWPSSDFLRLLKSNISELQSDDGIPMATLAPVFQDVLKIARDLSIRHVWIDALCIVQDDDTDWTSEASQMSMIYSHAQLTFAVNSNTGSIASPVSSLMHHMAKQISTGRPQYFFGEWCGPHGSTTWHLSDSLLASRGWCESDHNHENFLTDTATTGYQERVLSKRLVHLFPSALIWERVGSSFQALATLREPSIVNNTRRPEEDAYTPAYSEELLDVILERVKSLGFDRRSDMDMAMASREVWRRWQNCVKEYTARDLTQESDRLVAFAAVAKKFQDFTGDVYILGCFVGALRRTLTWQLSRPLVGSKQTSLKAETCRVPSWSWGAVPRGTVEYDHRCQKINGQAAADHCLDTADISFYQSPDDVDPGTWMDTKAIQIYGMLIPIKLVWMPRRQGYNAYSDVSAVLDIFGIPFRELDLWTEWPPLYVELDLHLDEHSDDQYLFLPVHVDMNEERRTESAAAGGVNNDALCPEIHCQGLVLRKSTHYSDAYERHGFASYYIFQFSIENVEAFEPKAASLIFQQTLQRRELGNGVDVLLV